MTQTAYEQALRACTNRPAWESLKRFFIEECMDASDAELTEKRRLIADPTGMTPEKRQRAFVDLKLACIDEEADFRTFQRRAS